MTAGIGKFKPAHPNRPSSQGVADVGVWPAVAAFFCGWLLELIGTPGQLAALAALLYLTLRLFQLAFTGRRYSFQFALLLGFLVNAEVFIRDFAMRDAPAGYLAVEYAMILLGLVSLPDLMKRHKRLVESAPAWLFLGICLWDSIGLFYSEDFWYGRITASLHWGGLACLLLGAAAFATEATRKGLLDGIILGTFLSLGVMLQRTLQSSSSLDLEAGFRFGHALVSAVQVGIVLTAGMLACVLKLISGYGKPRNALICLALLAPFCVATFSRGPLLAFFAGVLCLGFYRRRSGGGWKLAAAGLLLAGAVLAVKWALPSNFDGRYEELQGSEERIRIWAVVGEMWKESPVIGYGPGSWFSVYPRFAAGADRAPSLASDAHNFILQAASDGGSIGVALFVLFLGTLMIRIVKARSAMGLALFVFIFIIASLANFKLSVLFLILGAGLGDSATLPATGAKQVPRAPVAPARGLLPGHFINARQRRLGGPFPE
ncbi:MAG TPA: O-antigen ligase family protein [Verrucomicrobiales bacterium]|nr:O-antigen ligase family protein [Verrucomicrobiales bacterium]